MCRWINPKTKIIEKEQLTDLNRLKKSVIAICLISCYILFIISLSILLLKPPAANNIVLAIGAKLANTINRIFALLFLFIFFTIPLLLYRWWCNKLIRTNKSLREKEKMLHSYDAVVNSLLDSIGLIDNNGNIIFINNSWNKFFEDNGLTWLSYKQCDNIFEIIDNVSNVNKSKLKILVKMLKGVISGEKDTDLIEYSLLINQHVRWFKFQAIRENSSKNARIIILHREISERKEEELRREFERNNLHALINNTNDLVWSVDRNLNLITFNEAFAKTVKIMSGNSIKSGDNALVDGFDAESLEKWKEFYLLALEGEIFSTTVYGKIPIEIWSEISFYPIKKGNNIIGTACHSRDITGRMMEKRKLQNLVDMAGSQNNRLQNFAYIVSHNIRSHAANISSLVGFLEESESNEERLKLMKMLHTSSNKLDETIENLNEIITIQNDTNQQKILVNLRQEVNKATDAINHLILKTNTTLINNVPEEITILVVPSYLESILLNLITNAIKYSSKERMPEINVYVEKGKDQIVLFVKDNGQGLDLEKNRDKLFGMYKTFHNNKDARGIGLFITKSQIEAMNGRIEVESELGIGSIFKIYISDVKN